jgi:hypothetical protein
MRVLPTRIHGIMDWIMGVLLIALPFALNLDISAPEGWLPLVLGIAMLGLSSFTDYEAGLVRRIPMPTHLMIDAVSGALLALSPWLFGFSDHVWAPHLVLGVIELGTAAITQLKPTHRAVTAKRARA